MKAPPTPRQRLLGAALLALIPAGVFYGWGIQALAVFGLSLVAVLVLDRALRPRRV